MPPNESADVLIEARWVLPVAPGNVALGNHAVAIRGGRIVALGPAEQLSARFQANEHISRNRHALVPGFINAFTHASLTLLRGLPVHPPLMPWLRDTLQPAEATSMGPDFVRDGTQLAVAEMLRAGITAFGNACLFPEEAARVAEAARVRAVIGLPVASTPTAWAENLDEHFAKSERLWDEYPADHPWVSFRFAPQPPYQLENAALERLRRVADELDAGIAMQLHETEVEVHDGLSQHGQRPLKRMADLGLLRPGFTAVHMNHLDEQDLDLLARSGAAVVACPQSDLRLGSGSSPLRELLSRHIPVGIGSGLVPAAGALDILAEARCAALLNQIPANEALAAATLGAATSLGLANEIGSIEPGKSADLACIDLAELACQPASSPFDAVLFAATRQQITDVWIAGRSVVADKRLLAFDEQELLQLAEHWSARLRAGVAS
jgi:5-methylthioadenosine/S-adenosylhomocysteine deaminase